MSVHEGRHLTPTILVIAAAHAIPIFIAGAISNKVVTTVVALIMCVVAATTGGEQYTVIDLIAVGAAWFVMISQSEKATPNTPTPQSVTTQEEAPASKAVADSSPSGFVWLAILAFGAYLYYTNSDGNKQESRPFTEPRSEAPKKSSPPELSPVQKVERHDRGSESHRTKQNSANDLRHCLELPNSREIARCAER